MAGPLSDRLVERIRRHGPLPYDALVEAALYDPEAGFYPTGRGAGRGGADFVTSPEVGGLFGLLVARALDGWWAELDQPDPFVVVEVGAGRGTLARDVLRAAPACAPALRYVLVERVERLRVLQHEVVALEPASDVLGPLVDVDEPVDDGPPLVVPGTGPRCCALDRLPALRADGVVMANELLDNLPFRVLERTADGWAEVRVGVGDGQRLVDVVVPAPPALVDLLHATVPGAGRLAAGARLPVQEHVGSFVADACELLARGWVVCIDYAVTGAELVAREADDPSGWLRTYRGHRRAGSPLDGPGLADLTVDVVVEAFERAARTAGAVPAPVRTQAEWLAGLGLDAVVAEARAEWDRRAAAGDLAALSARSRVGEAAALTDPAGLGAHRVLVARRG